ncbi:hypothetical protein, partial [Glycomyces buryatensis]|uniref:hypothetical protein n=1 Tax=Glycomyces buryatensis TaxID=2570927 RepID=UPI001B3C15DA
AALAGGEFSMAVRELIFSLSEHDLAITEVERDTLTRLAEDLEDDQLKNMVMTLSMNPSGS